MSVIPGSFGPSRSGATDLVSALDSAIGLLVCLWPKQPRQLAQVCRNTGGKLGRMTVNPSRCADIFIACCQAMNRQELMRKRSAGDKEFFFQDWMRRRLAEVVGDHFSDVGRNGYPDFVLSDVPEGYELKGLALPGRKTIDSNSRFPQPVHRGRQIYYVFGRYPQTPDLGLGLSDLLICHASFINAPIPENRKTAVSWVTAAMVTCCCATARCMSFLCRFTRPTARRGAAH